MNDYDKWVADNLRKRAAGNASFVLGTDVFAVIAEVPPVFDYRTLFQPVSEACAQSMTHMKDDVRIAEEPWKAADLLSCMAGALEVQFLKMIAKISRASRVLHVGTFTGFSALAFADGIGPLGEIASLAADGATADVARRCLAEAKIGQKR